MWRSCISVGMRALSAVAIAIVAACSSAPPKALPGAAAAVPVYPAEATQQFDKATALLGSGDVGAAVRELEALIQSHPQYSGPYVNLGIAHLQSDRLVEAEGAFKQALDRNPTHAVAHNQLGIVYRRLGRFAEAEAAYLRAVEISPAYAYAYLNLGILYDLYLQRPEQALQHYERYLALSAAPEPRVSGWIAELKTRIGTQARTVKAGP